MQEGLINKSKIGHLLKVQSISVLQVLRQALVHIESVFRQPCQSKAITPRLVSDCSMTLPLVLFFTPMQAFYISATTFSLVVASPAYSAASVLGSTIPVVPANSDQIRFNLCYEVA